jgi:signal transduction histidine kinase
MTGNREQDRLEQAFAEQLSVLADLPAQRARLRQIDLDADNYLLTRQEDWLKRRKAAVADFWRSHSNLGGRIHHNSQLREWTELGGAFKDYLAAQDAVILRARGGGMTRVEAMRMALARDKVDDLVERMSRFGVLGYQRLDERRRAARDATFAMFGLVLAIGLLGAVAVSVATSRIIVGPILRLRDEAAGWSLGRPWPESGAPLPAEIGELTRTMRAMADKLNEQFEREHLASQLKSQLVSGVSHEFNNALAVIHTASALLRETEHSEAAAPWHDMLAANIRALAAMATNLLNLGRLESGKFHVEARRVELAPLLSGALDRLAILGRRKKQTLSLEIAADVPPVSADPDAIALVVANLLTNAFKYTHEGGKVVLGAARRPDGRVEVFVQDTGIGVAAEDREKIFGGYYRTELGKREAKGFGVGLALSRMILDAHSAPLALDSEVGRGSRFSFALTAF